MVKSKFSIYDLVIMSSLAAILFVQEQLLSSIPGVQLTIFLMVLYSRKLGFVKSSIIVILHVLLDNFYMSSFSLQYTPAMLIGWMLIPVLLHTVFKKVNKPIFLALLGVLFSFLYSWCYILPNYLLHGIDPISYLLSDIIFEIILAAISFITILLLYKPCDKLLSLLIKDNKTNDEIKVIENDGKSS